MITQQDLESSISDLYEGSEFYFLNNFYETEIEYKGHTYTNIQSAYCAAKFKNDIYRIPFTTIDGYTALLLDKNQPNNQKYTFTDNVKIRLMKILLHKKFSNKVLQTKLIETYPKRIIFINSHHETFFGVCECKTCKSIGDSEVGYGDNQLGILLMEFRDDLIEKKNTNTSTQNTET